MDGCLFCKIASGEIPSDKVYEDDRVIAFSDIDPQAPVHVLIVPKLHYDNIMEASEKAPELISHIAAVASSIAEKKGIDKSGFRLVINTGADGGQSVEHLHYHLLGGRNLGWPPG